MNYIKISVEIPKPAYEKWKQEGNLSERVEQVAKLYIDKTLPRKKKQKEEGKKVLVSLSYDFVKKAKENHKNVRDFIEKAISEYWLSEEKNV